MKPISTSLDHRIIMPESASPGAHPTLVLVHGRGADEEDLVGLARFFDERLLVLSVRAPFRFEYGGYTWYEAGVDGSPDPGRFSESHDRLSTFLDDALRSYPVDATRLFLLGFSMGAVMSLAAALTRPMLFRGVSANSGYIAENTPLQYRWDDLSSLNIFLAHGTEDPVVPVQLGRRARLLLEQSGARLVYREYPMGHEIGQLSIVDIAGWMSPLL